MRASFSSSQFSNPCMRLEYLKLFNFRNYQNAEVKTGKRVVVLVGDNAQGKTNFLEATYLLVITKSFRLTREADLIGEDENFARVEARFRGQGKTSKIEVLIKKGADSQYIQKVIKLQGQVVTARRFLGTFSGVLFSPEDINLIKSVPGVRRRVLDIIACQVSSEYCTKLVEYNKIVKNRNQVLVRIKRGIGSKEELIFWNNELVDRGSFIIKFRQNLTSRLNKLIGAHYREIGEGREKEKILSLHYLPSFSSPASLEEERIRLRFKSELLKKERTEIERQQSTIGPHRDDFHFILGGRNIVYQGSRGEFRSTILALKFAELDFLEEELGERPLLLLDDAFSELDHRRKKRLAAMILGQQTFITTTDLGNIDAELLKKALVLRVQAGKIVKA